MAGFSNDANLKEIVYCDNVDFSGNTLQSGQITTNGQLLIGSTANPKIRTGILTSPLGTLQIGYSSPNITLDLVGGFDDLHVAKLIVNSTPGAGGNYTTLGAALAASVTGDTIFVMPGATGTYTEDLIWKAGVNLTAFTGDGLTPTVTIIGKITCTFAGSATFSGLRLQTNSDYVLSVTGSSITDIRLKDCYLQGANNNLIQYTSSSGSSRVRLYNCEGDFSSTGIALYTMSAAGTLAFHYCNFRNTIGSTTASTYTGSSSGAVNFFHCNVQGVFQTNNSNATFRSEFTEFNNDAINTTPVDMQAGAGRIYSSFLRGGTAPALNSETTNVQLDNIHLTSTNTNPVSGAGAVNVNYVGVEGTTGTFATAYTGNIDYLGKIASSEFTTSNGIVKYDGTSLITSSTAKIDASNRMTNTAQPCFLAYLSSTASNVTGDGTVYQVAFDTVAFDNGSNFTTGASALFTAPVTGKYLFSVTVAYSPASVASGFVFLTDLVATSRTLRMNFSLSSGSSLNNPDTYTATGIIDMTANDTLHVNATASAGTKTTSISGSASPYVTYLSGYLVC